MSSEPSNVPNDPYHEIEFEIFLNEIGNVNINNWAILAEGLGVGRKTIQRWKKHPLAKAAISTAIQEQLRDMEAAGKGDWKMHREKLKMLGIKDSTTIEHEMGESVGEVLDSLERTDYGKLGQTARGQVVETNPPVQDQG